MVECQRAVVVGVDVAGRAAFVLDAERRVVTAVGVAAADRSWAHVARRAGLTGVDPAPRTAA
ncbi:hypothetical protein [Pseudonocardia kunmingensis]|uniref:Uncharacterized protein n=1 Tax=Pseudonocardia kunmingensis TaxID=630975 RepID=A0A543DKS1_9PSEU|nr:hypothetical protein [Pseudonocardia kunmingensis]TQM09940.1 hypothetical protein FB558_5718 [Pseudonocardia kunmingensis]